MLEAVTKDQLNTGLTGQLRYRVSRAEPLRVPVRGEAAHRARDGLLHLDPARAHRQLRGAAADRPRARERSRPRPRVVARRLHQRPAQEPARPQRAHGPRVHAAAGALRHRARRLADHRHRPAARGRVARSPRSTPRTTTSPRDISLAQAAADQKIVQSRRAVEIETLKAQAEVEPLVRARRAARAAQAAAARRRSQAYLRNVRLALYGKAQPGGAGGEA